MDNLHDKITIYGASSLTDSELAAIILDNKSLADKILSNHTLSDICHSSISRLRMIDGLGITRAAKIAAAAELGRRMARHESLDVTHIRNCNDAVDVLRPTFEGLQHEECWALFLTSSSRILERMRISQGGVQATVVDNRLITKRALELLASQVIISHNHPSGAAEPSRNDIEMTNKLKNALSLFDITLTDHIIISSSGFYSFRANKIL